MSGSSWTMASLKNRDVRLFNRPPGGAREYLEDNFSVTGDSVACLNGHVLLLYLQNDSSISATVTAVGNKFGCLPAKHRVKNLVTKAKPFLRSITSFKKKGKFEEICQSAFLFVSATNPVFKPEFKTQLINNTTVEPEPTVTVSAPVDPSVEGSKSSFVSDPGPSTSLMSPPPPVRLRIGDTTPRKLLMRKRLLFQSALTASIIKRYREQVARLKVKNDPTTTKNLRQMVRRQQERIKILNKKVPLVSKSGSDKEIARYKKMTEVTKQKCKLKMKKMRVDFDKKVKEVTAKFEKMLKEKDTELKMKHQELRLLLADKDYQIQQLMEEKQELVTTDRQPVVLKKNRKCYSTQLRMFVYNSIVNNNSTENIPSLIQAFFQCAGLAIPTDIPHRSTIEDMARELGMFCDLHAAEVAFTTDHLTLCFDSTTQEGVHINVILFTTMTQCHVIALDQLAGGTAEDYVKHIAEAIDYLAKVYSHFHDCDFQVTRHKIISNISNFMSTMQQCSRSALKSIEPEGDRGQLYGQDCLAGNTVLALNKLRYTDGTGDPKGLTAFFEQKGLPRSLIPRYRGNRLHIIFKICAILTQHRAAFLEYFNTVAKNNTLLSCLRSDFKKDTTMKEMCVLGLLGKKLTGPWMETFFAPSNSKISHIDGIETVRSVLSKVKATSENPFSLVDEHTDFFGNIITDEAFHAIAVTCPRDVQVQDMIVSCVVAVSGVLERQYQRYFQMELSGQLRRETATARLHNFDAEQVIGMLNAARDRAPNATFCFISSKIRAIKNNVIDFLNSLDEAEKEKVVNWAIHTARLRRSTTHARLSELKKELCRRDMKKKQQRQDQERRKVELQLRHQNIVDLDSAYPDLDTKCRSDLFDIMQETDLVGRNLCHLWYNADTQMLEMYFGLIERKQTTVDSEYVIAYWMPDEESYDTSTDYVMNKFQLAVDAIFGDLMLD